MLIHLWSLFTPKDSGASARHLLARSSWEKQRWSEFPVADSDLPRLFTEGKKRLPFIRDLFDAGVTKADPEDIVVYSNSDIAFCDLAVPRIALALQVNDAGYSFRRDLAPRTTLPTEDEIEQGIEYCGTDVFFFRVHWWTSYRDRLPDLLIAREAWDACLRVLIESTNSEKPLSLPNLCWHVRHSGDGHWESPNNRYTLPGQSHNLNLAKRFLISFGLNPASFGIRQ